MLRSLCVYPKHVPFAAMINGKLTSGKDGQYPDFSLYNTRENIQLQKIVALPLMAFIKKWPSTIWDKKNSDPPPKYSGPPPPPPAK